MVWLYLTQFLVALGVSAAMIFGLHEAGYFEPRQAIPEPIAVVNLDQVSAAAAVALVRARDGREPALDVYTRVLQEESARIAQEGYLVIPKSLVLALPPNYQHDMTQRYIDAIQKAANQHPGSTK